MSEGKNRETPHGETEIEGSSGIPNKVSERFRDYMLDRGDIGRGVDHQTLWDLHYFFHPEKASQFDAGPEKTRSAFYKGWTDDEIKQFIALLEAQWKREHDGEDFKYD